MNAQETLPPQPPLRKTFPKEERLHHKKLIDELFGKGSSFLVYPFKVMHHFTPANPPEKVQALIVVPKRGFKKAHDRNRLKRQIKEAYRHEKQILSVVPQKEQFNLVAFIYVAKEKLPFSTIRKKLSLALDRLVIKEDPLRTP